jgi:hypothetical protein
LCWSEGDKGDSGEKGDRLNFRGCSLSRGGYEIHVALKTGKESGYGAAAIHGILDSNREGVKEKRGTGYFLGEEKGTF